VLIEVVYLFSSKFIQWWGFGITVFKTSTSFAGMELKLCMQNLLGAGDGSWWSQFHLLL